MKPLLVLAGQLHPVGGIETHLCHLCSSLAADHTNASITMLVSSRVLLPAFKTRLENDGVTIREYACGRTAYGISQYARLLMAVRSASRTGTVLYTNGTSSFANMARRTCRRSLWIHQHHTDVTPSILLSLAPGYRQVLRECDELIACTPQHADLLDDYFGRRGRTIFLPYCKHEPSGATSRHTPADGRPFVVGFFGRLRRSKGIPTLLELAPYFREHGIECRLHGDDCETILPATLPPGVTWAGPYDSGNDLDRLMNRVDMVVLPTVFPEGLPLVITEAISRGVPVVSYDGGGVRHLRDFHRGLVVIPPNVDSLKHAIAAMREEMKDPELSTSLAAQYRDKLDNATTLDWWSHTLR